MVMLLAAGCSKEDLAAEQHGTQLADNVITLGVKEVVSPVTRADQIPGVQTFTTLKTAGFGVYGYKGEYDNSSSLPTLFKVGEGVGANKHVTFVTGGKEPTTSIDIPGSWDYTSATTANLVEWESGEKYTFFAYAPYMASAGTAPGITALKTDDTSGDPTISYTVATNPAESVDLLWGVRTDTSEKSGLPWKDVQQGQTTSAVLFTFYHALCALGLHAQVMVDQTNDTDDLGDLSQLGTVGSSNGCKVTLKSITITPATTAFHQSGILNLNNTEAHTPNWTYKTGTIANLELNSASTIDAKLLDPNTSDFEVANPTNYDVMTSESYDTEVPGITESANSQAIIKDDNLFMLIPQAAQNYTINIEYYITYMTTGKNYHREAHTGTATISNLTLSAGVKYYLNLVFGLTTFKVTVDAVDWEENPIFTTIASENGTSAGHSLVKKLGEIEK